MIDYYTCLLIYSWDMCTVTVMESWVGSIVVKCSLHVRGVTGKKPKQGLINSDWTKVPDCITIGHRD